MNDKILVYSSNSIIERDALMECLSSNDIESFSPARDMSRKYTPNTVDLSLGGYSVFFDGFKIFVKEKDSAKAAHIIEKYIGDVEEGTEPKSTSYLNKFYYLSIANFFIPIIPAFLGAWYLYLGLKNKEKLNMVYFCFSFFCYLIVSGMFLFLTEAYNIVSLNIF